MMGDNLKITILVDNQAGEGLIAEHGLSLWIEIQDKRILFDTGRPGAHGCFGRAGVARLFGIDLSVLIART